MRGQAAEVEGLQVLGHGEQVEALGAEAEVPLAQTDEMEEGWVGAPGLLELRQSACEVAEAEYHSRNFYVPEGAEAQLV